jgi:hypothetical protein
MTLVMTHNGGYDSILLVDSNDVVRSAFRADEQTLAEYTRIPADNWEINQWPYDFDPAQQDDEDLAAALLTIEAYGEEVGRNGSMSDERREFWGL